MGGVYPDPPPTSGINARGLLYTLSVAEQARNRRPTRRVAVPPDEFLGQKIIELNRSTIVEVWGSKDNLKSIRIHESANYDPRERDGRFPWLN